MKLLWEVLDDDDTKTLGAKRLLEQREVNVI